MIVCKEVPVVYNERRRPVRFYNSLQKNKNLLEAVRETFSDILESGEGSSKDAGWYLQTETPNPTPILGIIVFYKINNYGNVT